mgnify:CR=1 FL=1
MNNAIRNLGHVAPAFRDNNLGVDYLLLEVPRNPDGALGFPQAGIQPDQTFAYLNNNDNFIRVATAIVQHERKSRFTRFLENNPAIKLALEYHVARLARFLMNANQQNFANLLPGVPEEEIRIFRNIIAHGLDDLSISNMPMEHYLCRYTALILQRFPQAQQQVQQNIPPGP